MLEYSVQLYHESSKKIRFYDKSTDNNGSMSEHH